MKKDILFLCLLVFSAMNLKAQTAAKSVYAELGGPGLASLNFDTRFSKRDDGLGGRIGIGGFTADGVGVIIVPVGLNYLLTKDNKNYFEVGAGASYLSASNVFVNDNGDGQSASTVFGHLSIGYRLQPANGGFLFRAAIVPIFGKGFFVPYYAGIAFGYKF